MATTKPKSATNHKNTTTTTPATPRASKLGRAGSMKSEHGGSPSLRQNPVLSTSVDRSPGSVDSKPSIARRSPGVTTPPPPEAPNSTQKQVRVPKGMELQAQLMEVQEDLKKAKERLASAEEEKERMLEELKDAKRSADEADGKLAEALLARRKAEESSEIEKFRADELEQAGIEAGQRREEERRSEIEDSRNQHAADVAALLSASQELQRAKQELAMATEAKNTALGHADDAMRIAEINAEKVEVLSAEVGRLKSLLDSQLESKSNEARELVGKLDSEIAGLKQELEKAKTAEEKLVEMEALVEGFRIKANNASKAEANAAHLVDEFRKKAESLEARLEEASRSEKITQESLASTRRELGQSSSMLSDAESEIVSLGRMVEELELAVARHEEELEISNRSLGAAQQEASETGRTIEALKIELKEVENEKRRALSNEKTLASNYESLLEEKKQLLTELGIARDEGEKVKEAMDGLSSALHEVSTEARGTKEKLLAKQAEADIARSRIEGLESALNDVNETYEARLVEAKHEVDRLEEACERSEAEAENSRAEWNAKELSLLGSIRSSEEEVCAMKAEMDKLAEAIRGEENKMQTAREVEVRLRDELVQAETEVSSTIESMEEVKAECLQLKERLAEKENEARSASQAAEENEARLLSRLSEAEREAAVAGRAVEEAKTDGSLLKERLLDRENELQNISQENDDLRAREAVALEKIEELSALLAEAEAAAEKDEEKLELSDGEKEDCDLSMPGEPEAPSANLEASFREEENGNRHAEESKAVEVADKGFSPEREQEAESADDELDSKVDCANGLSSKNVDNNGAASPTKQQQQKKKKKPLLQKFGSLLKKKSSPK